MPQIILVLSISLMFAMQAHALDYKKHGEAWVYQTKGDFSEVKSDVIDAILGQGLVISYVSHSHAMLSRTAKAVGVKKTVFSHAESYIFCKAGYSHQLVQADPHNIVLCPWQIAVYALTVEPGIVYVSYRNPDINIPAYKLIQKLLNDIVHEALDD